ncbi:hypothetical protein HRbin17_02136 [bacterium HR17]|uniref:Uncharacterized protein n=1 Tax=Candidatus Fervidibacter japonicus TaxID=2035412 RepID=A0A2H5XEP2_9BACT|nr:hypothetical protein HRbin17_02136 [bacterium HR17]
MSLYILAAITAILSVIFYLILSYNIILLNKSYTYVSLLLVIFNLFNLCFVSFYSYRYVSSSHRKENIFTSYVEVLRKITSVILIQSVIAIVGYILIITELDFTLFLKIIIINLIVSYLISLLYLLSVSFRKYYWLLLLMFGGTIVLAPLITEAMQFLREPWLRSVLELWNWVVPFQVVSGLQNTLLIEGWQWFNLLIVNTLYVAVYMFIVISIALYLRQLKADWRA